MKCPVCGFRFWTYYTIREGKRCPMRNVRDKKMGRCEGKMVKVT